MAQAVQRILPGLVFLCCLFAPSFSPAAETIVVSIVVNEQAKGEYFVIMADDGDFFIASKDLAAMGLGDLTGKRPVSPGEQPVSLRSVRGVSFAFEEKTMTLTITVAAEFLPPNHIDFMPKRPARLLYPNDASAFLNYAFSYSGATGSDHALDVSNQLGVRIADVLFLSDSLYTKSETGDEFIRLMSSATYDWRDRMQRLTAGDFFASSGTLGSSNNMAGISFSKVYSINPYFITYPTVDFSGLAAQPSQASIYLNGVLFRTTQLAPGPFDLSNIAVDGGSNMMEIVIRDPYGNEQRIDTSFYSSNVLLGKGLHEYSYQAGFLRENYGTASNEYGSAAYSLYHRYGVNNKVTLGFRAEGTSGLYNFGPQATCLLSRFGTVNVSLAATAFDGKKGEAGALTYEFRKKSLSTRLYLWEFSKDYATINSLSSANTVRMVAGGGLGYSNTVMGSVSLSYAVEDQYSDENTQSAGITYSHTLFRDFNMTASVSRSSDPDVGKQLFFGISYSPGPDHTVSARHESTSGKYTDTLEIQENVPVGEGYGYIASVNRSVEGQVETYGVNPSVQYNTRYNVLRGDYWAEGSKDGTEQQAYSVSAAGAVVYVGGGVGITRPVSDSFAVVKTGDVAGIPVTANGQEMGKTDSEGKLYIPNIGSYTDNRISLKDRDLPLNYSLPQLTKNISPGLRSGSCIAFRAEKIQPVTGKIAVRVKGALKPVEFTEISLKTDRGAFRFATASEGEFYIEHLGVEEQKEQVQPESECSAGKNGQNVMPGTYAAAFEFQGRHCSFELAIPASDDMLIDLGDITACSFDSPAREGTQSNLPAVSPKQETVHKITAPQAPAHQDSFVLKVGFDRGGRLPAKDRKILSAVARMAAGDPDRIIVIGAYRRTMDEAGNRLELKKSEAVRKYLVGIGVDPSRVSIDERREKSDIVCAVQSAACNALEPGIVIAVLKPDLQNPPRANKSEFKAYE